MRPAVATTDDDAQTAPIPAIDLDEIVDADFLASLAASLEGSSSSSGSSA